MQNTLVNFLGEDRRDVPALAEADIANAENNRIAIVIFFTEFLASGHGSACTGKHNSEHVWVQVGEKSRLRSKLRLLGEEPAQTPDIRNQQPRSHSHRATPT
jgi:hypothetical protein